jgi:hypothetical protein
MPGTANSMSLHLNSLGDANSRFTELSTNSRLLILRDTYEQETCHSSYLIVQFPRFVQILAISNTFVPLAQLMSMLKIVSKGYQELLLMCRFIALSKL